MIAAVGANNELGKDNHLIWHLPDDFKRFKKLTTGHLIIMGRKTFESFPKPLPNRTHIIITRNENYIPTVPEGREKDVIIVHSLDAALIKASSKDTAFIIGGGEIYKQGLEVSDKIELTRVHGSFDADTFFPEITGKQWEKVSEEHHPPDERHTFSFTYETWLRT
jgi:dihydrofolate reductase